MVLMQKLQHTNAGGTGRRALRACLTLAANTANMYTIRAQILFHISKAAVDRLNTCPYGEK